MSRPVMDEQPMGRVRVEPAGFDECRDETPRVSPPTYEFCDPPVIEAPDVALWSKLGGSVP